MPARVLVVRLGALGDVVNALVFAGALKRAHPGVHIGWAVHDLARPLLEGHPSVDRVHVWRRGNGRGGLGEVVREVRAERYDLAADLQRIFKSSLLARRSGATRVLGWDRARCKELSWLLTKERIARGPAQQHMVDVYMAFAAHLGCHGPPVHVLPVDAAAESWADGEVARLGGKPILLVPGASKPKNRWPAERFGEVARELLQHGPVAVVGADTDRELAQRIRAVAGAGVHDLCGATRIPQLISLARRARLVISGDTGPMHIAVAVGAQVLALFGPADPRRTGPYGFGTEPGDRSTVVRASHGSLDELAASVVNAVARAKLA